MTYTVHTLVTLLRQHAYTNHYIVKLFRRHSLCGSTEDQPINRHDAEEQSCSNWELSVAGLDCSVTEISLATDRVVFELTVYLANLNAYLLTAPAHLLFMHEGS